ncbi:hypothetical protein NDU88_003438 [Pleurodeles waltl]|uniref:Uncharacterized protein n=1 Tax=Pleurodeles waltl TaxID=8319 RepID=A0AAV7NGN9_PLEWA|nr:hypothetical protein NDU88_003438 [Pleurodeles waltl]
MSDSTSSNTEVCVAPSQPLPPKAEETTHTSEDIDVEQITFTRKRSMTAAGVVRVPVEDVCPVVGAMCVGGGAGVAVIGPGAVEVDGPAVVPAFVGATWVVVAVLVVVAVVDTEGPPWANAVHTPEALSWR